MQLNDLIKRLYEVQDVKQERIEELQEYLEGVKEIAKAIVTMAKCIEAGIEVVSEEIDAG